MWMNNYEIDEVLDTAKRYFPELAPYAQYLSDWRDTVNDNTDGWAHWRAGTKCADKLSGLLGQLKLCVIESREPPEESEFKKAMTPIKSAATKYKLPAPELEVAQQPGFGR